MCGILAIVSGLPIIQEEDKEGVQGEALSSSLVDKRAVEESEALLLSQARWWMAKRGPDGQRTVREEVVGVGGENETWCSLVMASSLLQTRGRTKIDTPNTKDAKGNVLAFNGEIYDGLPGLHDHDNDSQALLNELGCCDSIPEVLSKLRGPWSLVYWEKGTQTLWFGRDVIGRRSLLQLNTTTTTTTSSKEDGAEGTTDPHHFIISSVSLTSESSDPAKPHCVRRNKWKEIPPGIYSIDLAAGNKRGLIHRHVWKDPIPLVLSSRATQSEKLYAVDCDEAEAKTESEIISQAEALLALLRESVRKRCKCIDQRHHIGTAEAADGG